MRDETAIMEFKEPSRAPKRNQHMASIASRRLQLFWPYPCGAVHPSTPLTLLILALLVAAGAWSTTGLLAQPAPQGSGAQKKKNPPPDRPFLGVFLREAGSKVFVTDLFPGAAASKMGLRRGDQLALLNDVRVSSQRQLVQELGRANVGSTLRIVVMRNGERVRIKGRIGGRRSTKQQFQKRVRRSLMGKPLAPPPAAEWWSREKLDWENRPRFLESLKGNVTIVFSFDSCEICRQHRFARMAGASGSLRQNSKVKFVGLYFRDPDIANTRSTRTAAKSLFEELDPKFPVAVVYYPDNAKRNILRYPLLHEHGVALVGTDGMVKYLQTLGVPANEFADALAVELKKLQKSDSNANGG